MNQSSKTLIQSALAYLAIRDRSEQELRAHLAKKTSDAQQINEVMAYVHQHRLVDDQAFGRQWAQSRLRHGKGDLQIKQELKQKGLSIDLIQQILGGIDKSAWFHSMALVLQKKAAKYAHLNTCQQKSKIYQLLSQHGYSGQLIDAFLKAKVE